MKITTTIRQAAKYGLVGVGNTLVTMLVIWLMLKPGGFSDLVSNVTGYAAGIVNSFFWNKQWTFRSRDSWAGSALRFASAFILCYLLQLGLLFWLKAHLAIDAYYNHLLAMAFYTVINFLMNKYYTFKDQKT